MTKQILLILLLLILLSRLFSFNYFSPIIKYERLNFSANDLSQKLKNQNLIINSAKVFSDSVNFLEKEDYQLDHQKGEITFFHPQSNVQIEYLIYPEDLITKYSLYREQTFNDSSQIVMPKRRRLENFSSAKLDITGSKTISLSVANNEDFSLDQSLFLRMNGNISRNIQIEAQLSDSESPITPEGSSREISNLDQIYIKLFGKNYELALGDLEMEMEKTRFVDFSPKFEGLKSGWQSRNEIQAALAVAKGKKSSVEISGVEAKQGPYYLSSENASGVQIVPGTEKVFLNGIALNRGADYSIDYSEGSITFSNDFFITENSHIYVIFQYSDENYRQYIYLETSKFKIGNNLEIRNSLIMQNDDKQNPLLESFSDQDIDSLKASGDKTVFGSGITETEAGSGAYIKIGNDYIFVGVDSVGTYNIQATYVGMNGQYDKNENGDFIYSEDTTGTYELAKELISPENKANYDLNLKYSGSFFALEAEGVLTDHDRNSFSDLGDNDNLGTAYHLGIQLEPESEKYEPEFSFSYRSGSENRQFFSEVESAIDNYEIMQAPDSLQVDEQKYGLKFKLFDTFFPNAVYRKRKIKSYAEMDYISLDLKIIRKLFLPQIEQRFLRWDQVYDESSITFFQKREFSQYDLHSFYDLKKLRLGMKYYLKKEIEFFKDFPDFGNKDENSEVYLTFADSRSINSKLYYRYETLDSLNSAENWQETRSSQTGGVKSYFEFAEHSFDIDISHREIKEKKKTGFDLAQIYIRNSFLKNSIKLNSRYSLKNIEYYPKIRELVENGYGLYDSTGVIDETGEGGWDWIVTAIDYDDPELTVEVNSDFSLIINPAAITDSFWKRLQSETNLVISENSTYDNKFKVYLLQPQILMNKEFTIYGRQNLRQSFWLDILRKKLSVNLELFTDRSLDKRYNDESEARREDSWKTLLRLLNLRSANIEISYENRYEEDSYYNSQSRYHTAVGEVRNRLFQDASLTSILEFDNENTNQSGEENDYEINSIELSEAAIIKFMRKYRLFTMLSFQRNFRKGSSYLSYLAEKKNGNIFKWSLNLDYRLNSFTSLNLEYSGDSYPHRADVHKLELEMKAEF